MNKFKNMDMVNFNPDEPEKFLKEFDDVLEKISPSDYITAKMHKNRDYNGQPHTDQGERGKQLVEGLTMRDIADCFLVGCFEGSGLTTENYPSSVYQLPWDDIDIIAVRQNMMCEIEKKMKIYPNVPELKYNSTKEKEND